MTGTPTRRSSSSYFGRTSFSPLGAGNTADAMRLKKETDEMINRYIAADNQSSGLTKAYQKRTDQLSQEKEKCLKMFEDMKWESLKDQAALEKSVFVNTLNIADEPIDDKSSIIMYGLPHKVKSCMEESIFLMHKLEDSIASMQEAMEEKKKIAKRKTASAAVAIAKSETEKLDSIIATYKVEDDDTHACSVPAIL